MSQTQHAIISLAFLGTFGMALSLSYDHLGGFLLSVMVLSVSLGIFFSAKMRGEL